MLHSMQIMEYEDYGKKMLIYAAIAIVGIFFGLQAMFGFPLFKSFESDSVSDARSCNQGCQRKLCIRSS